MFNPNYIYKGKVIRVLDGDTFEIVIDLGFGVSITRNIRLAGIDTPETWRPRSDNKEAEREHGNQATQFVMERIDGREIVLKSIKRGKYRFVAEVYYTSEGEQLNLTESLYEAGFEKKESYLE